MKQTMTVTDNDLFLSIEIIVYKLTQAQIDRHTNRQHTQKDIGTDTDTDKGTYSQIKTDTDENKQTNKQTMNYDRRKNLFCQVKYSSLHDAKCRFVW